MKKTQKAKSADQTETLQTLNTHIQNQINAGHEAPRTWLFKDLTLFFHHHQTTSPGPQSDKKSQYRHHLAKNTASFAGATITTSIDDPSSTHIIVDPTTSSSEDLSSIRESLSSKRGLGMEMGGKLPHIVTVDWIEESWVERTVLDEERMYSSLFPHFYIQFCVCL